MSGNFTKKVTLDNNQLSPNVKRGTILMAKRKTQPHIGTKHILIVKTIILPTDSGSGSGSGAVAVIVPIEMRRIVPDRVVHDRIVPGTDIAGISDILRNKFDQNVYQNDEETVDFPMSMNDYDFYIEVPQTGGKRRRKRTSQTAGKRRRRNRKTKSKK